MGWGTRKSPAPFDDRFATAFASFQAVGNGSSVDRSTSPVKDFSLQVKGRAAAATVWTVNLQVTCDPNWGWFTILTHGTADLDGTVKSIANIPATYFRVNATGTLTLGSATDLDVRVVAR